MWAGCEPPLPMSPLHPSKGPPRQQLLPWDSGAQQVGEVKGGAAGRVPVLEIAHWSVPGR